MHRFQYLLRMLLKKSFIILNKYESKIKNFSLAGDKFMIEKHLKNFLFTYGVFGSFNKIKERIKEIREAGN